MPLHFLHVSKSGGTAIKAALRPYAGAIPLVLHPHAVRLRDLPAGDPVVFFIRHPVDRFFSGFLSRQRQGRPRYYNPWSSEEEVAFARFPVANSLAEALSDHDLERRLWASEAMQSIRHLARPLSFWLEDETYLQSRKGDLLFVGDQKNMEADFERLRQILSLPESCALPQDDLAAHRSPPDSNRSLSPLAAANLLAWYAADIQLYEACRRIASGMVTEPVSFRILGANFTGEKLV